MGQKWRHVVIFACKLAPGVSDNEQLTTYQRNLPLTTAALDVSSPRRSLLGRHFWPIIPPSQKDQWEPLGFTPHSFQSLPKTKQKNDFPDSWWNHTVINTQSGAVSCRETVQLIRTPAEAFWNRKSGPIQLTRGAWEPCSKNIEISFQGPPDGINWRQKVTTKKRKTSPGVPGKRLQEKRVFMK